MTTASEKIKAYELEVARKKVKTIVYAAIVFFSTVILIMLCSGDRFNRYLAFFGLEGISNREGGVYADCALAENKDSPYCRAKLSPKQKDWEKLQKGGSPFTLYN